MDHDTKIFFYVLMGGVGFLLLVLIGATFLERQQCLRLATTAAEARICTP